MKLALSMIVKGSDEEAEMLSQCLDNMNKYVDGIFITVTKKDGEINKKVKEVCERHKAVISEFIWVNDFSKARNYNFSQVPKEYDYIMWLDADDLVRGAEKIKPTIEENPADAYSMNYLYAFDENKNPVVVHLKTQIVKNDGCVEWSGALHEDFKENRSIKRFMIKGIDRIHTSTDERVIAAKDRNLEVSLGQLKNEPDDPRSYWNVGNSYTSKGEFETAIGYFDTFLELSNSDEEKYIVRLRRAEAYWHLDKKSSAIDECRYAIGTKPDYPDAYNLMGRIYYDMRRYHESIKMIETGLLKKPPYTSIIVYNPRDYDYTPMMELAKAYVAIERPDMALILLQGCYKVNPTKRLKKTIKTMTEKTKDFDKVIKLVQKLEKIKDDKKLKAELDKIPQEFQSHPSICVIRNKRFTKKESSGKDLVFFCGYTEREWTPDSMKEGIGGSEEAIIHLSDRLSKKGWNVTVYANCGHTEKKFGNVTFKPYWTFNYRDKQDVVILWRSPIAVDYNINCDNICIDLHDVIPEGEFTEKRLEKINKIFVKSEFHKSLFTNIPEDKFVVVPNGIDSSVFEKEVDRDDMLLINTSSPDRSLGILPELFKEVKKQVPEAKCKWAYGWGVFDTVHGENVKVMQWKSDTIKAMEEAGIENLGRISHEAVAELYLKAGVFAYPSEFAEIDCISLSKAQAGGAYPVTTDFSAMGEKAVDGGTFIKSDKNKDNWCPAYKQDFSMEGEENKKKWVDAVVKQLKNPISKENRDKMRKSTQEKYDWDKITNVWDKELQ